MNRRTPTVLVAAVAAAAAASCGGGADPAATTPSSGSPQTTVAGSASVPTSVAATTTPPATSAPPVATSSPSSSPVSSAVPSSAPNDLQTATAALAGYGPAVSVDGPVETPCGIVATAITGNDTFTPPSEPAAAVELVDLRWDGSAWISTAEEVYPAWSTSALELTPLVIADSAYVSVGAAAPDGLRLRVVDVWEDGPLGQVERLDDSCTWVPADVVFPCGSASTNLRGGEPNPSGADGSVLAYSFLPNYSIEGDLPQPPCYQPGQHVIRWEPSMGAFQALPIGPACPNGYTPEGSLPIRMCEQGSEVRYVQDYLARLYGITADGLFGPGTQRALYEFQAGTSALDATGTIDADTVNFIASGGGDY